MYVQMVANDVIAKTKISMGYHIFITIFIVLRMRARAGHLIG